MELWVPLTEAARSVKISPAKLSNMVKAGKVESRKDPRDERVTLIDVIALRKYLGLPTEGVQ